MTEQTQEQGYTLWDVAAIASTIAGLASILLAVFLPSRSIGGAIIAIIIALILAIGSGNDARKHHRSVSWFSRIGSITAVIAVVIVVVGQLII